MQPLPQALAPLAAYPQWIVYALVPKAGQPDKLNKVPVNPLNGHNISAHNPAYWMSYDEAVQRAGGMAPQGDTLALSVGFVFTESDPFWFLDIDNCMGSDGNWTPFALSLCERLQGAAVEISTSGEGLHIIGTGTVPPHRCKNSEHGLEFYHAERFMALGHSAIGDAGADMSAALPALVAEYFEPEAPREPAACGGHDGDGPVPGSNPIQDDAELIERLRNSGGAAAVFGNACPPAALWDGDVDTLARYYPDNFGNRAYDASQADAALMSRLAFWTGGDVDRMESLAWQSGLMREKWTKHRTYLRDTAKFAVRNCSSFYGQQSPDRMPPPPPTPSAEPAPVLEGGQGGGPELLAGFQYLAPEQQVVHFAGCVYVQNLHRAFIPTGALLKPEQFKATYGGYVFALDSTNSKTTKNAWEAFVESQAVRYPKAEFTTFHPELPSGEVMEMEGRRFVNTYVPAKVPRKQGDPAPFLEHLAKLLPDDRDRQIVLAYMAACVQRLGFKFQWAPLIQGVEGNGKTLFSRCVAHAVGRHYASFPKAKEIGGKFNAWMLDKLFVGIEDVYYPEERREIIEDLKPVITNDWQPIELKGVDVMTADVCANLILNTNHRNAIVKTRNDRRFAIFFTAQQAKEDLDRDGMSGDYFPNLYGWLKGEGKYAHCGHQHGYAIVSEFLYTYEIPAEFDPAGTLVRAPETSSQAEVIAESLGGVEQEILEAIDEGRPGFAGGWVSSMALERLLEHMRLTRAIPHNRRREIMQALGYDWHPALKNGRVNNAIPGEGGKPKLFIRKDNPALRLTTSGQIARAYQEAQEQAANTVVSAVFGAG